MGNKPIRGTKAGGPSPGLLCQLKRSLGITQTGLKTSKTQLRTTMSECKRIVVELNSKVLPPCRNNPEELALAASAVNRTRPITFNRFTIPKKMLSDSCSLGSCLSPRGRITSPNG